MASHFIRPSSDLLLVLVLVLVLVVVRATNAADNTSGPTPATAGKPQASALTNPFTGQAEAVTEGREMYRGYCTGCHGGAGHGGKCPDLTDDIWVHGGSDAEIFHTISKGVSGTEMRNFEVGLKPEEIWKIIAFVRTLASAGGASAWKPYEDGDAGIGKTLFFNRQGRAQCFRCHMIYGEGGRLGPDLSRIAAKRTPEYIWESIIQPNADLVEGYQQIVVTTDNGTEYEGYSKNEDNFSLQMITTEEKIVSLDKTEIVTVTTNKGSAMLGNYSELLNERELHDLMAFLKTLAGKAASQ
jgi:putative heme-binding domain-containing protein